MLKYDLIKKVLSLFSVYVSFEAVEVKRPISRPSGQIKCAGVSFSIMSSEVILII